MVVRREQRAGLEGTPELSAEYRTEVVNWYLSSGKAIAEVASTFDLPESTVREWVWSASPDLVGKPCPPDWAAEALDLHDAPTCVPGVVDDELDTDEVPAQQPATDAGVAVRGETATVQAEAADAVTQEEAKAPAAAVAGARTETSAAESAARDEIAAVYAEALEAIARAESSAAERVARVEAAAAEAVAQAKAAASEAEQAAAKAVARSEAALAEALAQCEAAVAEAQAVAQAEVAARMAAEAAARDEIARTYAAAMEAVVRAEALAAEVVGRAESTTGTAMGQHRVVPAATLTQAHDHAGAADPEAPVGGLTSSLTAFEAAAVSAGSASMGEMPPDAPVEPSASRRVTPDRTQQEAEARTRISEVISRLTPVELWVHTTGRTVAEATEAALEQLGVDEAQAEVEVLTRGSRWLPGRVQIRARVRAAQALP